MSRIHTLAIVCFLCTASLLDACSSKGASNTPAANAKRIPQDAAHLVPVMENKIAEKIVRSAASDIAMADPEIGTRLGSGAHDDKWDAPDGSNKAQDLEILRHYRELMRQGTDMFRLTARNRARAALLEYDVTDMARQTPFGDYADLVNPVDGPQVRLPLYLMTVQPTATLSDFKAYVSRIRAFAPFVDQVIAIDTSRRQRLPALTAAGAASVSLQCKMLTTGRPFDADGDPSPILADFSDRIAPAKLDAQTKDVLVREATSALEDDLGPACTRMTHYVASLRDASAQGAWAMDKGDEYYQLRLDHFTSTNMTPAQVHEIGIQRMSQVVSDITDEMNKRGIEGSPAQFMDQLRNDRTTAIESDEDTVQQWLNKVGGYVFNLDASLDDMIAQRPDTDLEIRQMEALQRPAGVAAAYDAIHGLGIFYIDLPALRTWEVEATTYRYTIPGQHVVPASTLGATVPVPAFDAGWALYSLQLPTTHGYYTEQDANLGRLVVTAEAIAEAIVDVGMNAQKWTREQAVDYLMQHSVVSRSRAEHIVDRILVEPGAATAALIGADTILRLEAQARTRLDTNYSAKAFHRVVLQYGPVTMPMLIEQVNQWLDHKDTGAVLPK